jgi:hypothetical protein
MRRDVLDITPDELRDRISIKVDREIIKWIDEQRGCLSRSDYVEMVFEASRQREHPHLPPNWTPEEAAKRRFDRLVRYRETGV